jgi:hypothetical protein
MARAFFNWSRETLSLRQEESIVDTPKYTDGGKDIQSRGGAISERSLSGALFLMNLI